MIISKKDIVKDLSRNLTLTNENSSRLVDFFLSLIKKNIKQKTLKISGFGSFSHKKTPQRIGRNPKTGESFIIVERDKPTFKASFKIKEILN